MVILSASVSNGRSAFFYSITGFNVVVAVAVGQKSIYNNPN
jgi:hypothetical protein